jgi:hypothetical protein
MDKISGRHGVRGPEADRVSVRALNEVADWGPSDHCKVVIEVEGR